ncbi:MAG: HAD family hydrolase [Synechococcaceae cyanobacterium]
MAQLLLRGTPLAKVDVVLFDKDGTLSCSEPMLQVLADARIQGCLERMHERHPELAPGLDSLPLLLQRAYGVGGGAVHPAGTTAVGSRLHNLISTATVLAQHDLGWPEALAIAEDVFAATDHLHGQPGVEVVGTEAMGSMLQRLATAGLKLAVISNDSEAGIRRFLARQGLTHLFDPEVWSADHHPCKPNPDAVHGLCRRLGTRPECCALIGDANSDLHMARQAGAAVAIGYRAGWSRVPRLDPSYPQLDHWNDLEVRA